MNLKYYLSDSFQSHISVYILCLGDNKMHVRSSMSL